MNFFSYVKVEVRRLFCSKAAWLMGIITLLSPYLVSQVYKPANEITRTGEYLANYALGGALAATLLFAVFTISQMSRTHQKGMNAIMESIAPAVVMNGARLLAMLILATVTASLTILIYLPITIRNIGSIFSLYDYVVCYLVLLMLGMWLGCLLGAAVYQITQRSDVSIIILIVLVLFCMSDFARSNFLLRWINPIFPLLSDNFSNRHLLSMTAYNRLVWLLLFGGLWVFSLLCTRRYGQGLCISLLHNTRKVYIPVIACVLLISGGLCYVYQPFINDSATAAALPEGRYSPGVTLHNIKVDARPNLSAGTQNGTAKYLVSNKNTTAVPMTLNINSGYRINSMIADGKALPYTDLNNDAWDEKQVEFHLPPGKNMELVVDYSGYPMVNPSMIIGGCEVSDRYLYLIAGSFAPVISASQGLGLVLEASITLPGHLRPLVDSESGDEDLVAVNEDGSKRWKLTTKGPMMYLYAADYVSIDVSVPDMSIEFLFSSQHREVMERMDIENVLREVALYGQQNIGPLTFTSDNKLKLIQMSIFLGGGYAGEGTSIMDETAFAEAGLKDPLRGASGQEIMIHEFLHQWWGMGVMFASGSDPEWSAEGFTVYSTYRLIKGKYGEEYANEYYVKIWQGKVDVLARDFYVRHPEYFDVLPKLYRDDIFFRQSEAMRYCVMPLKMLKAAELVGGEERMDEILRELYENSAKTGKPLTYDDFLAACELTRKDLIL